MSKAAAMRLMGSSSRTSYSFDRIKIAKVEKAREEKLESRSADFSGNENLSAYIAGALAPGRCRPRCWRKPGTTCSTRSPRWSPARGCRRKKGDLVREDLRRHEGAFVVGSRIVTSAANAALANGMLGHADETDDSHSPSQTHPGCGVVAAAFAMAERERAGGTALPSRGSRSATTSAAG